MAHYLVVAHQTADSEELVEAVRKLAEQDDATFTLLVPATPVHHLATWTEGEAHAVAIEQAEQAKQALEAAGASIGETKIGDASPLLAVTDELLVNTYDAVVISTFPLGRSRWLGMDVVHRLERSIDLPVIHVVAGSQS